jgi:hypothetical protein
MNSSVTLPRRVEITGREPNLGRVKCLDIVWPCSKLSTNVNARPMGRARNLREKSRSAFHVPGKNPRIFRRRKTRPRSIIEQDDAGLPQPVCARLAAHKLQPE